MGSVWIQLINMIINLITWGVIIHVIFGMVLDPFHPARDFTSRLFEPLLNPIRQILPQTGMFDFSPIVLILLVQLIGTFFTKLVY